MTDTADSALIVFFFFFQAEDGIRDLIVTGVQTCALTISNYTEDAHHKERLLEFASSEYLDDYYDYATRPRRRDRKSVVKGKSVDLGGRRIIKKKKERNRGETAQ